MKGIDKYGCVEDLDLAKRIIKEKFTGWPFHYVEDKYPCFGKERTVEEWLERVDKSLEASGAGFSIRQDNGYFSLGGPDGWSGFVIQEINAFFEEEGSKELEDFNPNEEVMCTIYDKEDDKFITFVLHELD